MSDMSDIILYTFDLDRYAENPKIGFVQPQKAIIGTLKEVAMCINPVSLVKNNLLFF